MSVALIGEAKKIRLRDTRKPRHGWFDYEIFDVFGDELQADGIAAYMTLARLCYGGHRVRLSIRELGTHARMKKDRFAKGLKRVIELGLVIEHKPERPKSPSSYDLVDVKELAAEYLSSFKGAKSESKALRRVPGEEDEYEWESVSLIDRLEEDSAAAPYSSSDVVGEVKTQQYPADAPSSRRERPDRIAASGLEQSVDSICLLGRQIDTESSTRVSETTFAINLSENEARFQTDLSVPTDTFNKKQETSKERERTRARETVDVPTLAGLSVLAHPYALQRQWADGDVPMADRVAAVAAIHTEAERRAVSREEAGWAILRSVERLAREIPREQWRFLKPIEKFFQLREYRMEPEDLCHQPRTKGGQQHAGTQPNQPNRPEPRRNISPAVQRGLDTRQRINAAVERRIAQVRRATDGPDAGAVPQPGTAARSGNDVPGGVGRDGLPLRPD